MDMYSPLTGLVKREGGDRKESDYLVWLLPLEKITAL